LNWHVLRTGVAAVLVAAAACSGESEVGSSLVPNKVHRDPPPTNAEAAADLFGLRVGSRWTYLRSGGTLRWKEITACEDVPIIDGSTGTWKTMRAYVRENRSELGVTSVHYLTADADGVHRIRRDDIDGLNPGERHFRMFATYEPPGPRLLNGPYPAGEKRRFSLRTFEFEHRGSSAERWESTGFTDTSALDTLLEPESLVVVAGRVDTIGVERQWTGHNAHNVVSHYAAGVGEVRERTIFPGEPRPRIEIEELVDYAPGYGVCDPTTTSAWDSGGPLEAPLVRCANAWGTGESAPTDPRVDAHNCGGCGRVCPSRVCANGRCVTPDDACADTCVGTTVCCHDAWGRGEDGCTSPSRDPYNCGTCGHACPLDRICDRGACACSPGSADCGGTGECVDLLDDHRNCGACGNVCPDNLPCSHGVCGTCVAVDLVECNDDVTTRCVDLQWEKDHCGSCNHACGKGTGTTTCEFGECVSCAAAGLTDCDGDCADLQWSDKHCGGCGQGCAAEQVCVFGVCVGGDGTCPEPCPETDQICCNGACVDPRSSDTNCGGCGVQRCTAGCTEACRNGRCVPVDCGGGDD
jgi:hypothetical protein